MNVFQYARILNPCYGLPSFINLDHVMMVGTAKHVSETPMTVEHYLVELTTPNKQPLVVGLSPNDYRALVEILTDLAFQTRQAIPTSPERKHHASTSP